MAPRPMLLGTPRLQPWASRSPPTPGFSPGATPSFADNVRRRLERRPARPSPKTAPARAELPQPHCGK
jgi:hypothetical protein